MGARWRHRVAVGAVLGPGTAREHVLAAAVVRLGRIAANGDEGADLHPEVLGPIRVGEAVAEVALDAVHVVRGIERRAIGGRGASLQPARRRVAADAEIPGPLEVLLGDGERGPEDRVAARVRHHAPVPVEERLHGQVVVTVAVGAEPDRLQRRDRVLRLGARHLDVGGDDVRGKGGGQREKPQDEAESSAPDGAQFTSGEPSVHTSAPIDRPTSGSGTPYLHEPSCRTRAIGDRSLSQCPS